MDEEKLFNVPDAAREAAHTESALPAEADGWTPLCPVPSDAPQQPHDTATSRYAKSRTLHAYYSADRRLLSYVERIEREGGAKDIRPWSYCEHTDGRREWRQKYLAKPRTLYGIDRLALMPNAPVLVVEGEKTADAAVVLFRELVCITSPAGARSAAHAEWSPVAGRRLIIWPDHDADGQRYANDVARLTRTAGAEKISIVTVPDEFPPKWDLADPLPEGWTQARLLELLKTAMHTADPFAGVDPSSGVEFPFRLTETGVEHYEQRRGEEGNWVPICMPRLEVLAYTRNPEGKDWGRLVRVIDPDGKAHLCALPMSLLSSDGAALRERLFDLGLVILNSRARNIVSDYISNAKPPMRARSVPRIGWHDGCYVLPDRTFGYSGEPVFLQTETALDHAFRTSGDLAQWRQKVARPCVGNSRLVFTLCLAFAPPLLQPLGQEGGGFHLRGLSSIGKSTALKIAASVWGAVGGKGMVRTWRATANGLESTALGSNDALLCLDELGELDGREAGPAAYMLANGEGKARARRDGTGRPPARWLTLFLSTGEISLADKMAEASRTPHAGQETRFIDIEADAGAGQGIFEALNGFPSGDALARHLVSAVATNYGTPIRAFLDRLCADLPSSLDRVRAGAARFVAEANILHSDGQVQRVAHRFGLIAAAGALASCFEILPFSERECFDAAHRLFAEWVGARGGMGPAESIRVLHAFRRFIDEHGDGRFARIDAVPLDRPTINRVGFRRDTAAGPEYLFLRSALDEVCPGISLRTITEALNAASCLVKHAGGRKSIAVKLPNLGPTRVYAVDYQALCAALENRGNVG